MRTRAVIGSGHNNNLERIRVFPATPRTEALPTCGNKSNITYTHIYGEDVGLCCEWIEMWLERYVWPNEPFLRFSSLARWQQQQPSVASITDIDWIVKKQQQQQPEGVWAANSFVPCQINRFSLFFAHHTHSHWHGTSSSECVFFGILCTSVFMCVHTPPLSRPRNVCANKRRTERI